MIVSELKKGSLPEARGKSWSLSNSIEFLPIGPWILSHDSLIELLVLWRTEHRDHFFFNTIPTFESMRKYLIDFSIGDPERILFLIEKNGVAVGHMGFSKITSNSAEVDQVMKSFHHEEELSNGFMESCLEALIDWGRRNLQLENLSLEVVSTNSRAIRLYLKCGFEFLSEAQSNSQVSVYRKIPTTFSDPGDRFKVRMVRTIASAKLTAE